MLGRRMAGALTVAAVALAPAALGALIDTIEPGLLPGSSGFVSSPVTPGGAAPLSPGTPIELPGGPGGLDGAVAGVAIGPGGERAYISLAPDDHPASVLVLDIATTPGRVVAQITGVKAGPIAVSPDGKTLDVLHTAVPSTVSILDVGSERSHLIGTQEIDGSFATMVLSPRDEIAYLGGNLGISHALGVFRTDTWQRIAAGPNTSMDVAAMTLAPDGRTLLALGALDGDVIAIDTVSGKLTML